MEIGEVGRQVPPEGVLVEFQRFSPCNAAKPEKHASWSGGREGIVREGLGSFGIVPIQPIPAVVQTRSAGWRQYTPVPAPRASARTNSRAPASGSWQGSEALVAPWCPLWIQTTAGFWRHPPSADCPPQEPQRLTSITAAATPAPDGVAKSTRAVVRAASPARRPVLTGKKRFMLQCDNSATPCP